MTSKRTSRGRDRRPEPIPSSRRSWRWRSGSGPGTDWFPTFVRAARAPHPWPARSLCTRPELLPRQSGAHRHHHPSAARSTRLPASLPAVLPPFGPILPRGRTARRGVTQRRLQGPASSGTRGRRRGRPTPIQSRLPRPGYARAPRARPPRTLREQPRPRRPSLRTSAPSSNRTHGQQCRVSDTTTRAGVPRPSDCATSSSFGPKSRPGRKASSGRPPRPANDRPLSRGRDVGPSRAYMRV
jgi:hypothetical protein